MSQKFLLEAVQDKKVVTFTYLGVSRVVEPYALGLSPEGDITLMGWEMSGMGAEGWRNYLIDKMRCTQLTSQYFRDARSDYSPEDLQMQHVLAWVGAPERSLDLFSGYR